MSYYHLAITSKRDGKNLRLSQSTFTGYFTHGRSSVFLVLLLSCAALILRVYDLSGESLWLDELDTLRHMDRFPSIFEVENKPFFYYFCVFFWTKLFGTSDFALRFPSVIFGVGSVPMIFIVGRLLFGNKVALISSLLLCISEFHVFYSRMAIVYSLFVFLTLASVYFFLLFLKKPSARNTSFYVLFSTLFFYTYAYGVFVLLFQNAFFLARLKANRSSLKRWLYAQTAILVLSIPCLFSFIVQARYIHDVQFFGGPPPVSAVIRIFREFNNSNGWLGVSVFLLFFFIGLFSCLKTEKNRETMTFLLLWVLVPTVIPLAFSHLFFTIFLYSRFVLAYSLPYYILMAKGLANVRKKTLFFICLFIVFCMNLCTLNRLYHDRYMTEWRSLGLYLSQHTRPGERILVVGYDSMEKMTQRYYEGPASVLALWAPPYSDKEIPRALTAELAREMDRGFSEIRADLDQAPTIWFVHVENPEYTTFERYYLEKLKDLPGYKVSLASQLQTGRKASRSGIGSDAINLFKFSKDL